MFEILVVSAIPLVLGGVAWVLCKKIVWFEWVLGAISAFLCMVIATYAAEAGLTSDYYTQTGLVTKTVHHPEWVERYTDVYTDSKGNTRTRTRYRTHEEHWMCHSSLGDSWEISQAKFIEVATKIGPVRKFNGNKSGFHSGDPHIYVSANENAYSIPVTSQYAFENRPIYGDKNLFQFVDENPAVKTYPYPVPSSRFASERVINSPVSILEWDRMNAVVNNKGCSVIIAGYDSADASVAEQQRAAWKNGKKTDLVICYHKNSDGSGWCKVFGWTDSEECKKNIERIVVDSKEVNDEIVPKIMHEIMASYKAKNWSDFDYISVSIPTGYYIVIFIIVFLTQAAYWFWAAGNEFDKTSFGVAKNFYNSRIRRY